MFINTHIDIKTERLILKDMWRVKKSQRVCLESTNQEDNASNQQIISINLIINLLICLISSGKSIGNILRL